MNDNVARRSGQKPMSVGDFARAQLDELNPERVNSLITERLEQQ